MSYQHILPAEHSLLELSRTIEFPASRDELITAATQRHAPRHMINFLNLFAPDDVFESRLDFVNQAEEVKLLIREKRIMPKEYEYSQQD